MFYYEKEINSRTPLIGNRQLAQAIHIQMTKWLYVNANILIINMFMACTNSAVKCYEWHYILWA